MPVWSSSTRSAASLGRLALVLVAGLAVFLVFLVQQQQQQLVDLTTQQQALLDSKNALAERLAVERLAHHHRKAGKGGDDGDDGGDDDHGHEAHEGHDQEPQQQQQQGQKVSSRPKAKSLDVDEADRHRQRAPDESKMARMPPTEAPISRAVDKFTVVKATRPHAVVSFYCGHWSDYVKVAMANRKAYCDRHGYVMVDLSQDAEICRLDPYMARYNAMQKVMHNKTLNVEGVLWADVDSIFINFGKSFDEVMDPRYDLFITAGSPYSASYAKFSNNGHVYIRNTQWGRDLVDELTRMSTERCRDIKLPSGEIVTHINWLKICNHDGSWGFSDQGLIMVVVRNHTEPEWNCHVKHVPFRTFNSEFPWYRCLFV